MRSWKLSTCTIVFCAVIIPFNACAQSDPCNVREQWVRFILVTEFFAGRLGLDRMANTLSANVSPACARYQIGSGGPNRPPPITNNPRPYGCPPGSPVCSLPDGTSFALR
jgi:hypothetical protein